MPPLDGDIPTAFSVDVDPLSLSPCRNPLRSHRLPTRYAFPTQSFTYEYLFFLTSIHSFVEPTTYKETSLDANWHQDMEDELTILHKTGIWELIPLLEGKETVCPNRIEVVTVVPIL
ncbi:hypothetical protein LWI28_027160 [Acer negundo]|uniref:Uncharacterized protein n=1 Tax=Acer negundo TaxID=4023 RepID=A0AAD5IWA2_ACENE|nr:hypothetical protein LWI28_027160 [Acer negundo]